MHRLTGPFFELDSFQEHYNEVLSPDDITGELILKKSQMSQ